MNPDGKTWYAYPQALAQPHEIRMEFHMGRIFLMFFLFCSSVYAQQPAQSHYIWMSGTLHLHGAVYIEDTDEMFITDTELDQLQRYDNFSSASPNSSISYAAYMTPTGSGSLQGIAYDPENDLLYYIRGSDLYWTNRSFSSHGSQSLGYNASDLTYRDEHLYIVTDNSSTIRVLDTATLTQQSTMSAPISSSWPSIAYDEHQDVFWFSAWGTGTASSWYSIDATTGSTTTYSSIGSSHWGHGMDYNDGYVYLSLETSTPDGLLVVSIDCDDDGDGYCNAEDNCPSTSNSSQSDADGDGDGDDCDSCTDVDNDGYGDTSYSANTCSADCDDNNSSINPDADEYCDSVDNDCDGSIDENDALDASTWYADSDSDGFGNSTSTQPACNQPTGYVADASDCDDTDASTYPGADEYCDGHDDNCDGTIDEDTALDASTWYADSDSDGYGDSAVSDIECSAPTGYVADATDCDDADANTYPGADEYCDGHDDNCDGTIDEDTAIDASTWYADSDGDGEGDANVSELECYQPSGYVSSDTDCDDSTIVLNTADADADGYTSCDSDCNDTNGSINVDAEEIWYDGIDQNCDGWSDFDQDGDGFDHVDWQGDDCDDEDPDINVDAEEIWYDGVDQDCDNLSDFDADQDGQDSQSYGGEDCDDADPTTYKGAPDSPYDGVITDCDNANDYDADGDGVLSEEYGGQDCDDANSDINPDAEEVWYDGIDQDCDGNDDDQDEDGFAMSEDCDDEDADSYPDNGLLDADCNPIESSDTGDTGLSGGETDKEGGCFSSTTGGQPVGTWATLLAGLLFFRRRRTHSARRM